MSDCERIVNLFRDFHDKEVEGRGDEEFLSHLHRCPQCSEEFRWYKMAVQALNTLHPVSPSPDFLLRVNARIRAESSSPSVMDFLRNLFSSAPYLPLPAGAAALSLVAVLGFFVYNQTPAEMVQPTSADHSSQQVAAHMPGEAGMVPVGLPADQGKQFVATLPRPAAQDPPSFGLLPRQTMTTPGPVQGNVHLVSKGIPTTADTIGADNLTVESPRIDMALESLKKILPDIRGRVVEERRPNGKNFVVGVVIPSTAYGHLTTELINHGAVEVGLGQEAASQAPAKKEDNNVLLYIRFVRSPEK
jgi:hypothetical protein